jgi:hypothetical protein
MAVQEPRTCADVNAVVGGYLRHLAFAQSSQQKMFGYKRAAAAILALEMPLTDLVGPDGALPRISGIGPGRLGSSKRFCRPASRPPSNRRSDGANAALTLRGGANCDGIFSVAPKSDACSRILRSQASRFRSTAAIYNALRMERRLSDSR